MVMTEANCIISGFSGSLVGSWINKGFLDLVKMSAKLVSECKLVTDNPSFISLMNQVFVDRLSLIGRTLLSCAVSAKINFYCHLLAKVAQVEHKVSALHM